MTIGKWKSLGYVTLVNVRYRMWQHPDIAAVLLIATANEKDTVKILEGTRK